MPEPARPSLSALERQDLDHEWRVLEDHRDDEHRTAQARADRIADYTPASGEGER
jgi:hypothetical protein